ncbi:MAG: FmdB family transcriptional regulator [Ilumatobacter sp.]|uniref:FmdB family zinc ribbon protein n=1 Tax=Ilumatobacter sp. TaxID=1967498 RepID=UPI00329A24C3
MPTYVYKFVKSGETIEVQQAFTDDSLTEYTHPKSGKVLPVKKVFQPVGVTFKGSGFFKTDNRGSSASTPPGSSDSGASSNSDSATSKDSGSKDSGSKSKDSTAKSKESGAGSSATTKSSTTSGSSSGSSN